MVWWRLFGYLPSNEHNKKPNNNNRIIRMVFRKLGCGWDREEGNQENIYYYKGNKKYSTRHISGLCSAWLLFATIERERESRKCTMHKLYIRYTGHQELMKNPYKRQSSLYSARTFPTNILRYVYVSERDVHRSRLYIPQRAPERSILMVIQYSDML